MDTKVTTVIVNDSNHGLTMKVGNRNCYARLTSVKKGAQLYKMQSIDLNWTYQEFLVQDRSDRANSINSDDCCDYERITIKDIIGKFDLQIDLRKRFRRRLMTDPPHYCKDIPCSYCGKGWPQYKMQSVDLNVTYQEFFVQDRSDRANQLFINSGYARLTSVKKGAQLYKMQSIDLNWTYQEFLVQDRSDRANQLFINSDDCCDYERITIKEIIGKFDLQIDLRKRFRRRLMTDPPHYCKDIPCSYCGKGWPQYKMQSVDLNVTYQEFLLQDRSDRANQLFINSDDCCDYERITIKEIIGKFDVQIDLRKQFRRRLMTDPPHYCKDIPCSYCGKGWPQYKMQSVDLNVTYQEFLVQDKSDRANQLFINSDDCCDYERITIKEIIGKFDVQIDLRKQFRSGNPEPIALGSTSTDEESPGTSSCWKLWLYKFIYV